MNNENNEILHDENSNETPSYVGDYSYNDSENITSEVFLPSEEVYFAKAKKFKSVKILNIISIIFYLLSRVFLVLSFVTVYMSVRKKELFLSIFKSNKMIAISIVLYFVFYEIYRSLVGKKRTKIFKIQRMLNTFSPYQAKESTEETTEARTYFVKRFLIFDLVAIISLLIGFAMLFIPFITVIGEKHSLFSLCIDGIKVLFQNFMIIFRCFTNGESFADYISIFETTPVFIFYLTIKSVFPKMDQSLIFLVIFVMVIYFVILFIKLALRIIRKLITKIVYLSNVKKKISNAQIKITNLDLSKTNILLTRTWTFIVVLFNIVLISFLCIKVNSNLKILEDVYKGENIYKSNILFIILPAVFIAITAIVYTIRLIVYRKSKVLDEGLWYFYDYKIWLRFKYRKELKVVTSQIDEEKYNLKEYEKERKEIKKHQLLEKGKFAYTMHYVKRVFRTVVSTAMIIAIMYVGLAFADYFGVFVSGKYTEPQASRQSFDLQMLGKMQRIRYSGVPDGEDEIETFSYRIVGSEIFIYSNKPEYEHIKDFATIQNGVIRAKIKEDEYIFFVKEGKTAADFENKSFMDKFREFLKPATKVIDDKLGDYMHVFTN